MAQGVIIIETMITPCLALLIFNKLKRDVIFEVIVIDTFKPTGQCSLENFRTLIISFISVNSIMKRRPSRINGQRAES